VPISAILFGGRRSSVVPLVQEARSWRQGVFLGSIMASETTAAATGEVGRLRRDPFAMLPFCGYNMGDYLGQWLHIGASADPAKLPKLYYVNWFRRSPEGRWLWPGFGENSRVLAWIFGRVAGTADAAETLVGLVPGEGQIDLDGLNVAPEDLAELLRVDVEEWRAEVPSIEEHYASLGDRLPVELRDELDALEKRLSSA
jgi:phosphoenolpyruvate carboxykinase (GTP)